MRSTKKIDEILPQQSVKLIKLSAEELGKLIKAKALQAVAMHFAMMGLDVPTHAQSSHGINVEDPS